MTYAIVNSDNELLAYVGDSEIIKRMDIEVKCYNGTEPLLQEKDGTLYIENDAFVFKADKENEK
jgi:hypothetical protein